MRQALIYWAALAIGGAGLWAFAGGGIDWPDGDPERAERPRPWQRVERPHGVGEPSELGRDGAAAAGRVLEMPVGVASDMAVLEDRGARVPAAPVM